MEKLKIKYEQQISLDSDINQHIPTLFKYGKECKHITEMGVRWVSSTWAFLYSQPEKLISYDIVKDSNIDEVISLSQEYKIPFEFHERDVLSIEISPTDLLFIDTLHTYNQLINELIKHSEKVSKYIILHDTVSFGYVDENIYSHASDVVKSLNNTKQGLMNAVIDFLNSDLGKNWEIFESFENNNGLTILKRK